MQKLRLFDWYEPDSIQRLSQPRHVLKAGNNLGWKEEIQILRSSG
jgi:hypothetical protein